MDNDTFRYIMERISAEHEYTVKKDHIIIILLIIALLATNIGWICYENSFEDVTTIEQDADTEDGGNILQNVNGSVMDGTGKNENN